MGYYVFLIVLIPLIVALIWRPRSALSILALVSASLAYYGLLVAVLIARVLEHLDD